MIKPTHTRRLFPALILLLAWDSLPAHGATPRAPEIIGTGTESCTVSTEICGDEIDQDCNGSDLLCPGADRDLDGYAGAADCDDTDRKIYPGIAVTCDASCGTGTRTCQSSGQYTACSCTPLCEAVGSGRCYYISLLTGTDSNPGSFASPWKTFRNILAYYSAPPPGKINLAAGDVVYLLSGQYSDTYMYDRDRLGLYLRGLQGTTAAPIKIKAYPGANGLIAPAVPAFPMRIDASVNVIVEGLEITRSYGSALAVQDSLGIEIRNLWIHDNDGIDNNNIAGINVKNTPNLEIHHSLLHDNYDRQNADTGGQKTENSRNIVLFDGGTTRIHHNVIFQTPPVTDQQRGGGCVTYKHAASVAGATFEVDHNILWNCSFAAIGTGTPRSRIHHNFILNSDPVRIANFGGKTFQQDIVVEKNTVVGSNLIDFSADESYGPLGLVTIRSNVVYDRLPYGYDFRGMLRISPYGTDLLFQHLTAGKLSITQNCYFNPNASLLFTLFAENGGPFGVLGGSYSFSGWQALGYDAGSVNVDPGLTPAAYAATHASCAGRGWFAP